MNPFYNCIEIMGNVGKKPVLRYLNEHTVTTRLSIAVSEQYRDQERTEWFAAILYGRQAELACQHLNTGDSVFVRGAMHSRRYEQNGTQQTVWEIQTDRLVLL